jgi:hypothetical protein
MKIESLKPSGVVNKSPIDRVEALEKEVSNLNMAIRVSQMLLKQALERLDDSEAKNRQNLSMLNDFQYRLLGLQAATNVDISAVAKAADDLKLTDWNKASDAEDEKDNLVVVDSVSSQDNIVILTSTTPNTTPDVGIFRSRTSVSEIGNPELIDTLIGKTVGDKFEFDLNGSKHVIELLGVRAKKPQVADEQKQ